MSKLSINIAFHSYNLLPLPEIQAFCSIIKIKKQKNEILKSFAGNNLPSGIQFKVFHSSAYCYTLLRFGGRQPLCGSGVTSVIEVTSMPELCTVRIADSRPEPGPFTKTSALRIPAS